MKFYLLGCFMVLSLLIIISCESEPKTNEATDTSIVDTLIKDTIVKKEQVKASKPPTYDTTKWVYIGDLEPSIVQDMRYATENNFVKEKMYNCGKCFLRPEVAEALVNAHKILQEKGYGIKVYDCYRPRPIQQKLWDKVPNPNYVTPPAKGSMHNRGAAVDLTIVDSKGEELDMGTEFDYFGRKAHHTYTKHSEEINANRTLLKSTMETVGFSAIRTEWWHYSYKKKSYPISDMIWDCDEF